MKILHTADWHINSRLGRHSLNGEIHRSLQQIAAILDSHQVDVMVVAGDIIENTGRLEHLRKAVSMIKEVFQPFLEHGGTILMISGNHDSEPFFDALRDALDLVAPGQKGLQGTDPTGRLYVAPNPRLLLLADPHDCVVQFALMPYPSARYFDGKPPTFTNIAEKHRAIQGRFQQVLHQLEQRVENHLPSILVSHMHVRGVRTESDYRISEQESIVFEPSDIPTHWAYIAYGHIHKAQSVLPGSINIRYAGNVVRMDRGEREEEKSVVLFEVGPAGLVEDPQLLPLVVPPIYEVEISDPDLDMEQLETLYPERAIALTHCTIHWNPNLHHREHIRAKIEELFPRWYEIKFTATGRAQPGSNALEGRELQDVAGTVRAYLENQLAGSEDADAILALAERLLAEEVG